MNQYRKTVLAIAALCVAGSALAQDAGINPSWYIQPSIHAFKPDSGFGINNGDKPIGYGAGLKFGKALSQNWDVQMGITSGRASNEGERYKQHTLGVDGLYLFSRDTFRPFLLIGAGLQNDRSRLDAPFGSRSRQFSPYLSAGLGFQAVISDRLTFQADVRDVHGFVGGNKFPKGSFQSDNIYVTLGLNIAFDGPAVPPPATPPPPAYVAEAPPAPPAPVPVPPPARFEKITLSATELFTFDSAVLNSNQPKLDDIAKLLTANSVITDVAITGHADRLGSDKYNQKLSERRANAVKAYLVSKGVAADRLNAVGKGEANPVAVCTDKKRADLIKCLEPNRRVEVEQITVERRVQ